MRQGQALRVLMDGGSVFLTGAPGAGKTFVLNDFIRRAKLSGKRVAVTASTGIAATHIGGTTIHSWSGLGIREELSGRDRAWLKDNQRLIKRYNSTDILVVDEVSMLHGKRLDMVNKACKLLRQDERPFGGLQVVLVGDLFQLPPVNRGELPDDFVHQSAAWSELAPKMCYLNEQHRQAGGGLLQLLEAMRRGEADEMHEEILAERLGVQPNSASVITRLYAHNADVDAINITKLRELKSETKTYHMQTKGQAAKVEQLTRGILAPEELELAVGAEVMFVANNFTSGFANGTRGQVVGFSDKLPIVQLAGSRRTVVVEPHTWALEEDGRVRAEAVQLPLRLAWAITIHKSQGMSLAAAEVDLSQSFTPGMGYVALSRVRSLEGLYLQGINRMALQLHPAIFEFDKTARQHSDALAAATDDYEEPPEETPPSETKTISSELFEKLRVWRTKEAKKRQLPPYMIASNKALEQIATHQPTTETALLAISGVGPKMMEQYGQTLLKITRTHLGVVEVPQSNPVQDFLVARNIKLSDEEMVELKRLIKNNP